ncbi:hypothetical protein [Microvirga guangxiensis]|uniref:Uncharacterized protein n=1 Tax=Microvirga guangxiensis TaxID=549386 RepID=A0A1G5IYN7_9HYPH|nr:hypothetical protein [Microvirga guangxiensis]SCY80719.1 hypothetical protein SAMN02927923_02371 [Microvirga guangxiensis]
MPPVISELSRAFDDELLIEAGAAHAKCQTNRVLRISAMKMMQEMGCADFNTQVTVSSADGVDPYRPDMR